MTQHDLKPGLERLTTRIEASPSALTAVLERRERRRRAQRARAAGLGLLIAIGIVIGSVEVLGERSATRITTTASAPAVSRCAHTGPQLVLAVVDAIEWSTDCWEAPAETPLSIMFTPVVGVPD